MKNRNIVILGGDNRQRYLSQILKSEFEKLYDINSGSEESVLNEISKADVVVFPIPVSKVSGLVYSDNSDLQISKEKVLNEIKTRYKQ